MKQVLEFIREQELIEEGDHVIAGVSGGADSVYLFFVLLEFKKELNYEISVVHVNHNIRGEEALRDENYVKQLCQDYKLPFYSYSYPVQEIAKAKKISEEEAGRLVRREAFEDCRTKHGGTKIAMAHHQNDLAETMLYHLARGTGLAGLAAISPKRDQMIRPLLCMNRQEIEHDLDRRNIKYLTDSTNESDLYMRNKIRHHMIPYLVEEVNPKAVRHMAETASLIGEIQRYLESEARRKTKVFGLEQNGSFLLSDKLMLEQSIMQKYVVRQCISKLCNGLKDITQQHVEMVRSLFEKPVGKRVNLPGGLYAVRKYESVEMGVIHKEIKAKKNPDREAEEILVSVPGKYMLEEMAASLTLESGPMEAIPEKKYTKWLNYDRIKGNLVLRKRMPGDYLVVNQAGGRRKLKDYFIDQKIPQENRDEIWLLAIGQEILWVVGYRINESYKVSSDTKEILRIQIAGGSIRE